MKKVVFLLCLIASSSLLAQFNSEEVIPFYEHKLISAKNLVFVNHASTRWDYDESARHGVQQVLDSISGNEDIATIGLLSGSAFWDDYNTLNTYYFDLSDVNYVVSSPSGTHMLTFNHVENAAFTGGNFTLCLCEAIRDFLLGSKSKATKLYFVTDAIYDSSLHYKRYQDKNMRTDTFEYQNLATLIDGISDKKLVRFIENEFLGGKINFCPHQRNRFLSPLKFRFSLFRNMEKIGQIGIVGKKIEIHFITSDDFKELQFKSNF